MSKRIISLFIVIIMTMSLIIPVSSAKAASTYIANIKIGDYVQLGKYNDEPILWRCVDIDTNGPLMLADQILTIKPFDAAAPTGKTHKYLNGNNQADTNDYRSIYGSDLWSTSNMRSWLNSSESEGNVKWLDGCPPISNPWGYNAYDQEKGFLAEGNFSANEKTAIKRTTQISLLNPIDVNANLIKGGTESHTYSSNIMFVVQNYDTSYFEDVTDDMFLLDVKQLNKVYQNKSTLGTDYWIGKPTQKAVEKSTYKPAELADGAKWNSWIRSPYANSSTPCYARYMDLNGTVSYAVASGGAFGARPAFYINLSSSIFKVGNGEKSTPYALPTLTGITVTTPPTKTEYVVGQTIDITGLVVKERYNDGTTVPVSVTATNISGFNSSSPVKNQTITVTVDKNTATFNVDIIARTFISDIKIGDYLKLGKYNEQPILWRCVDIDANGPLMLSDKILTIKPFDAAGNHKYLNENDQAEDIYNNRTTNGSNLWSTSNMRSWLNSTASEGNVTWLDGCPPTEDNVYGNAYDQEKGFLEEGNFSSNERTAIKAVTQKSLLNSIDVNENLTTGGTENQIYSTNIANIVQNYNDAYFENVTDNMFLLDLNQLNKVYQNASTLGTDYWIGKPTQKAVEKSTYKDSGLADGNDWMSWSRSPYADSSNPNYVRSAYPNGYVTVNEAKLHVLGARPAFYINLSSSIFKFGNGGKNTPYALTGITVTTPPVKTRYLVGQTIDLTGLVVTETYDDGTTAPVSVTATNISGFDSSSPITSQPIAVTVDGMAATFNINIIAITGMLDIKIGEYLELGKYNDEPILWRCVDIDTINGPLMLADKILTIKAFDAAAPTGKKHKYLNGNEQADDGTYRTDYGSNLWSTSNMRSWLNSSESAGNVIWLDGCPPTGDKIKGNFNAYDQEKGFLVEGNFSANEKTAIKEVTQKSLLNAKDLNLKTGGTANHILDTSIGSVVKNYDTAYFENVTDKMFLLDVKQLNKVYQNTSILGTDYWIGKPTQKAVEKSTFKDSDLNEGTNWRNWNRSPSSESYYPIGVRYVYSDGTIGENDASSGVLGARPAFYINLSSEIFKLGSGKKSDPYALDKLTQMSLVTPPTKIEYVVGQTIDLTGLVLKGSYNDGTTEAVPVTVANISGFDSTSPVTNQLVTITVDGKTATFNVNIIAKALTSIAVTTAPTKVQYVVGQTIDLTGLVVTGSYNDGTTGVVPVTIANISGFNSTSPVTSQPITVTVNGKTATFNVNVIAKALTSIVVTTAPTKVQYVVGQTINLTGLVVTGSYNDGTTAAIPVTIANISGFNSTSPVTSQPITVTVDGKTATFNVNIIAKALTSIAVTTAPTKVQYVVGQTINLTGLVVTGSYNDGTTGVVPVTIANISGFNSTSPVTSQPITVTVDGKTATFNVNVIAKALTSIAVTTAPTKVQYVVGQSINLTGLVVTGSYNDGTTAAVSVTIANISGFNSTSPVTSQPITVTVDGKTATFNVNVIAKALTSIAITTAPTKVQYVVGQTINLTGLVVTGSYNDGTTGVVPVTATNISGFNSTSPVTSQPITVTVDGKTATFNVNVVAKALTSIAVTTAPTKVQYVVGQTVDLTGLVVTGTYNDGTTGVVPVTATNISGFNSTSPVTSQPITVIVDGKTATFNVNVMAKVLTSIAVTTVPTKVQYVVGQSINLTGLVVTGTYNDGTTGVVPVTATNISGFNSTSPVTSQIVTVTVNGKTATFTVNVIAKALTSIAITTAPTKVQYVVGQTVDLTGLVVTGTYNDGTTGVVSVTATNISGFNSTSPVTSQPITVTVDGKTATFNVSIIAKALTSIAVTTAPTKVQYVVGQSINLTGLVVTGTYNDGTTGVVPVTIANISGFNSTSPVTSQPITVTVDGKTATFNVNVIAKALTSIAVTTAPTKVQYVVGQTVDLTGLVVTGSYNDGTNGVVSVTSTNITGFDSTSVATNQLITVTVNGKTATFNVNVVAKALTSIAVTTAPTKVQYVVGQAIDLTGLVVTGSYNDGTTGVVPVTATNISGFNSSSPVTSQLITVTVNGKTATFNVSIIANNADINGDGKVDINDLKALENSYNSKKEDTNYKASDDTNSDGVIDIFDLVRVSKEIK